MKQTGLLTTSIVASLCMLVAGNVNADYVGSILGNKEDVKSGIATKGKKPLKQAGYSPYAGKNYPAKPLWGDTHLHTKLSLDARAFGVTLGPSGM